MRCNKSFLFTAIKTIIIQIIILVFCFTILDTFLWLFYPVQFEPSRIFKQRLTQNISGLKREIIFELNSFGFRAKSMNSKEKQPGTFRIFCLGASTTIQPFQSIEDTWCAFLEKNLNRVFKSEGMTFETVAYGIGGMKAIDLLAWVKLYLLQFKPDLVVTLMAINDLSFNGGINYSYTGLDDKLHVLSLKKISKKKIPKGNASKIKSPSIMRNCKKISQLCRRLNHAKYNFIQWWKLKTGASVSVDSKNLPILQRQYRLYPLVSRPQREPDPIHEFSDAMSELLRFLNNSDIDTIVLGQPVLWKKDMNSDELNSLWFYLNTPKGPVRPSSLWLEQEISRYNNVQSRHANNFDATYIDLDRLIPKNLEHYFDDCHFTDRGSMRVATEIFPIVKEQVQSKVSVKKLESGLK